jgi:mevalonyl-CoA ligase
MTLSYTPTEDEKRPSIISGPSEPALLNWTFNDLLNERLSQHANNVALISQHQDETITYAELHKRSEKLASALYGLGVRKDDRVGVLLGNRSEYAVVSQYLA